MGCVAGESVRGDVITARDGEGISLTGGAGGAGQDGEGDVEVELRATDPVRASVWTAADGLGEALFAVHSVGVSLDELSPRMSCRWDDDGRGVAAEAGDDQLPDRVGCRTGWCSHRRPWVAVLAVAVDAHDAPRGGGQRGDVPVQARCRMRRVMKVIPRREFGRWALRPRGGSMTVVQAWPARVVPPCRRGEMAGRSVRSHLCSVRDDQSGASRAIRP